MWNDVYIRCGRFWLIGLKRSTRGKRLTDKGVGCGVGGTIEGVGNKRVAGTPGSRASANGDDWGEVESIGTTV